LAPAHSVEISVMTINLLTDRGCDLSQQRFNWKDLVGKPISKLDDDAFTRVRVILMNGIEHDSLRTKQVALRMNRDARVELAKLMRVEHHQATMINWLMSADHSPLETTIAFEQVAVELTASVAEHEPDPYLAQAYRFALLEDFDHLYRYAAMLDRLEGKDASNITQGYTDIVAARDTIFHHRAPEHELVNCYERDAALISKLHAVTLTGAEYQTHDYYMNIGPMFSDPLARQLYAEIASVEAQHITHYGSMVNPDESLLEKLLLQEATEVFTYASCVEQEPNPRIKAIWERFLDYELGHLQLARRLFEDTEGRDAAEILGDGKLRQPIEFREHRDFVRRVLDEEENLRKNGVDFVDAEDEGKSSLEYRDTINSTGSPSSAVSEGYVWTPGTELARRPRAA
jgi:hypothetical protein